jgi:hypothetical protein
MPNTREHTDPPEFWADCYRGRQIAIFTRVGNWYVYLDHVLQRHVLFATAEDAILWLTERIDEGAPARLN